MKFKYLCKIMYCSGLEYGMEKINGTCILIDHVSFIKIDILKRACQSVAGMDFFHMLQIIYHLIPWN